MKEIFEKIVKKTDECSKAQDSFILPGINDCQIIESDYSSGGATLYGKQYDITNGEERIVVTYESKDKCRTFQIRPDMNIVTVKYFDKEGKLASNYSESWEDRF